MDQRLRESVEWAYGLDLLFACGKVWHCICVQAAISACEKAPMWTYALDLLSRMRQFRLASRCMADGVSSSCAPQFHHSTHFVQQQLEGVEPDTVSNSVAISACEKEHEWI